MDIAALPGDYPQSAERHPLVIERFLRDRDSVWRQIEQEHQLNTLIRQMLASSTVSLACYGAVIGFGHSVTQALSSAVKLPVLFLLTMAICLPTLYLFNLLCGGRLSARQALALVLAAITVTSSLGLAFAPITLFFMISAWNYNFFILLNVAILTLTGAIGLHFLVNGMRNLNRMAQSEAKTTAAKSRPIDMRLLYGWLVLYGFVGTQLGWTLRPIFGSPDQPFALFRTLEGNFYTAVVQNLMQLFQ